MMEERKPKNYYELNALEMRQTSDRSAAATVLLSNAFKINFPTKYSKLSTYFKVALHAREIERERKRACINSNESMYAQSKNLRCAK